MITFSSAKVRKAAANNEKNRELVLGRRPIQHASNLTSKSPVQSLKSPAIAVDRDYCHRYNGDAGSEGSQSFAFHYSSGGFP